MINDPAGVFRANPDTDSGRSTNATLITAFVFVHQPLHLLRRLAEGLRCGRWCQRGPEELRLLLHDRRHTRDRRAALHVVLACFTRHT